MCSITKYIAKVYFSSRNIVCKYLNYNTLNNILFFNLVQFDTKLARAQTKSKSYPDTTILLQSIYRRVCAFCPITVTSEN